MVLIAIDAQPDEFPGKDIGRDDQKAYLGFSRSSIPE